VTIETDRHRLHDDPKLAMSYATRVNRVAQPYSWPVQRGRYWEVVDALLDPAAHPTGGACRSESKAANFDA
jgi:hypothetical protein